MPHVTEEIWTHLPGERDPLIVSPWPQPDARFDSDAGALDRVQEAALTFRRSGVRVALGSEDEERVFAAVVRPERQKAPGDAEAEIARLRKEIARAEAMLANERFVGKAPGRGGRGRAGEARALQAGARALEARQPLTARQPSDRLCNR